MKRIRALGATWVVVATVSWGTAATSGSGAGPYFVDPATEFGVSIQPGHQTNPAITGSVVVWDDNRNGNYDIYGKNLSGGGEFPVTTNSAKQTNPAISGNIVVWQDNRNGNYDIYGKGLSGGSEFAICNNAAAQYLPSISGSIVAWRDFRDSAYYTNLYGDIYGKNLATGSEFPICANPLPQGAPTISGHRVVWRDLRSGNTENWDIYGKDLSTGVETAICADSANQTDARISGDNVIWRNSDGSIYGKDLSTGSSLIVGSTGTYKFSPAIGANLVVWHDLRAGTLNADIYGFDVLSRTEFPVRIVQGEQENTGGVAISGNTVAWADSRNGDWDIYGNYISYTDSSLSLGASGTRLNTASPGGAASTSVTFSMSQTADAFVDSLVLNHGDGTQENVPFNQSPSLKFIVTASHTYTVGEGIDSRTYAAVATAYGPADASTDLDRSASGANVTILRSPLAALSLDGDLVEAGSVLEVEVGQLLSFHGAPAIGFIEEALLKLDGSQVMRTTSASGLADESLFGTLTIPQLPLGSDLLLEYLCTNTGSGLNANTWSATLHVVPEPGTISLLVCGFCSMLCARRRGATRFKAKAGAKP